jgi:hypothetical protein
VATLHNITFACEEPIRLADFWAAALGYVPIEVPRDVLDAVDREIEAGNLDPTGWAMPPRGRRAATPVPAQPKDADDIDPDSP